MPHVFLCTILGICLEFTCGCEQGVSETLGSTDLGVYVVWKEAPGCAHGRVAVIEKCTKFFRGQEALTTSIDQAVIVVDSATSSILVAEPTGVPLTKWERKHVDPGSEEVAWLNRLSQQQQARPMPVTPTCHGTWYPSSSPGRQTSMSTPED